VHDGGLAAGEGPLDGGPYLVLLLDELAEHQGVTEAGVVGAPDSELGEVAVAFIVGSASATELDAHLLERIARFK
jgi:acyl-coenzyme A synthetase/AMP-(fatty) acid ligase